ncbi:TetR-like C-terminal domain-containing protein [Streptomyces kanamyceticus]|uniref:TetR-like C-terminal domain-containing protein n=1 Tax=Streptomyces kanamyceticus TaxID=1967 RepID=UPI0037DA1C4E
MISAILAGCPLPIPPPADGEPTGGPLRTSPRRRPPGRQGTDRRRPHRTTHDPGRRRPRGRALHHGLPPLGHRRRTARRRRDQPFLRRHRGAGHRQPPRDLERYAADLAKDLCDPDTLALVRATIGIGGEQGAAACRGERQQQLEAVLERERARDGRPPTLERTTDAVLAPLYYRAVFTDDPLTPEWTRSLVSHLLPG